MESKTILEKQAIGHESELIFAIRHLLKDKEETILKKGDEITIVVNSPERKITITENDIRKAFSDDGFVHFDMAGVIINKLFKGKE